MAYCILSSLNDTKNNQSMQEKGTLKISIDFVKSAFLDIFRIFT